MVVLLKKELGSSTLLSYQATNPTGPGGIVSGRDFVLLRKSKVIDGKIIVCYGSEEFPELSSQPNLVRYQSNL